MNYSFIIPVYNCKEYLTACVESIRAVGVNAYEILLIDDGSTDGSGALCDTLAAQYPEIRVVHQANSGASAARNRGLREAQGEKVMFVDADDTLDSVSMKALLTDPRCAQADLVIYGMSFNFYRKGACYRKDSMYYDRDMLMTKADWSKSFQALFEHNSLSSSCTKIFKRDILHKCMLEMREDMFLYEDLEFVLRYLQNCETILNAPAAIYQYRQAEDEGNAGRRLARIDSLPEFLVPIETALMGLENVPNEQKNAVLVQLHQGLARGKITVSDLAGIKKLCREYAGWYRDREMTVGRNKFHQQLTDGKALTLLLQSKKTALRHAIAVRVKACLKRMR